MSCSNKQKYKSLIEKGELTCCIVRDDNIVFKDTGRGIAPLLFVHDNEPYFLNNAFLFDKIIGRAAAIIALKLKAKYVYGMIMSEDAMALLDYSGIEAECKVLTPSIRNRDDTGICPIEDSIRDIPDDKLEEAVDAIRKRVEFLKASE